MYVMSLTYVGYPPANIFLPPSFSILFFKLDDNIKSIKEMRTQQQQSFKCDKPKKIKQKT